MVRKAQLAMMAVLVAFAMFAAPISMVGPQQAAASVWNCDVGTSVSREGSATIRATGYVSCYHAKWFEVQTCLLQNGYVVICSAVARTYAYGTSTSTAKYCRASGWGNNFSTRVLIRDNYGSLRYAYGYERTLFQTCW